MVVHNFFGDVRPCLFVLGGGDLRLNFIRYRAGGGWAGGSAHVCDLSDAPRQGLPI